MFRSFIRASITVPVMAVLLAPAGSAIAQTVTLRSATWVPPVHHMTKTLAGWTDEVDRASGGTLKIKVLPPGLAKPPGQYDLAKNGVVDMAWGVPAYTRGRFPLVRVAELPFLAPSAEVLSRSVWEWYEKHGLVDQEFNDTKLLMVFTHGPGVLHTKKQVLKFEDMQGMKIRAGGGGVAIAQSFGAVPVAVPATKTHESLQRGTADGVFFPWEAVRGFRLAKLVKYHLEFPGGLYATPFFMTMNKASWNKLSDAHKEVLNRVGRGWGSRLMGKGWDAADAAGMKDARANGNKIRTVSPKEFKRFVGKLKFVEDEWIAKADKAGVNGKALLADLKAIIKKNSE